MKKYAIYTSLVGGYDMVQRPTVIDDRFDYILYTDNTDIPNLGVWIPKKIEYKNNDLTKVARYAKTHSNALLSNYEATLYIDASMKIQDASIYERVIELCERGVLLASVKHPYRDCIYDEAYMALANHLDSEQVIFDWCHRLRAEGFPRHFGLYESGVLYRMNNAKIKEAENLWWNIIEQYSRRDQLSLQYVLWKQEIASELFLDPEEHTANSNRIIIHKHNNVSRVAGRRGTKQSFLEHARGRCRIGMEEKSEKFKELHYWMYGLNPAIAKCVLMMWGWYTLIVYGPIVKYRAYMRHKKNG